MTPDYKTVEAMHAGVLRSNGCSTSVNVGNHRADGGRVKSSDQAEANDLFRSGARLAMLVAGIALCIRAGVSLLVPAAYLVALIPLKNTTSTRQYLLLVPVFLSAGLVAGIIYYIAFHKDFVATMLFGCGFALVGLGRLRGPSRSPTSA